MIPIKLRLIREHNRLYKCWMRLLWHLYGMQSPIVLMVHGFKPTEAECKSAFQTTKQAFEKLMQFLIDKGWPAMTYPELKEMVATRNWKPKHFYLTFDDTYDTVYTEAFPILQKLNIPFTMFVTQDLIDKPDFITTEHLKALSREPLCTIGAHAIEHKMFRYMTEKETMYHWIDEKRWLEQNLNVKVDSFAFPYGRVIEVSNKNRRDIKQTDYTIAFSAIEGTLKAAWYTGNYYLPRVNVSTTFIERFTQGKFLRYTDCEGR